MILAQTRTPALRILANGIEIPGAIQASIISGTHFGADRFRTQLALAPTGASFWSGQDDILLDVQIGLNDAFRSLVQGLVDTMEIDPLRGTLLLEGRDLTAALIESRTQESFANATASQIAEELAARHGLAADVTPTTTPVGRYYQLEHDSITLNQFSRATTEWDLLVFLARQEGFDVYVEGTTLHFTPPALSAAPTLSITPDGVIDLKLERALTLARNIEVTVKSWNARQQQAFTQTARATRNGGATGGRSVGSGLTGAVRRGATQHYVYVRPNLTPDQALQLAQRLLTELSQHERIITFTMPGDLVLTPRNLIALNGTGTDFDQTYHVAEIDRRLSISAGYVQHVRATNLPPAADATPPANPPIP